MAKRYVLPNRARLGLTRKALIVLIASVSLSALMGIAAFLSGDFGELEGKVLLTTLCVTGASILALASGAAWERDLGVPIAVVGMAGSLAGFAMAVLGIWSEIDEATWWRLAGSLAILGTWGAHASLLALARLSRRFHLVAIATVVFGALLAAVLVLLLWEEDALEEPWRVTGVLSVLVAAGTILVPVFRRLDRGEPAPEPPDPDAARLSAKDAICCPYCGRELPESVSQVFR